MKKSIALLLALAMLLVLASCGNKPEAPEAQKPAENAPEVQSQEKEPAKTEPEVKEPEKEPEKTAQELYEGFIAGEVPVYADRLETDFNGLADEEFFEKGKAYTRDEFLERFVQGLRSQYDESAWLREACYDYIDCGQDGEDELLVTMYSNPIPEWDSLEYDVVIKAVDGKLQARYMVSSSPWGWGYVTNKVGMVSGGIDSGYNGFSGHAGILNADCEYERIYSYQTDRVAYLEAYDDPLAAAIAEKSDQFTEDAWLSSYIFGDEDAEDYVTLAECYCSADAYDNDLELLKQIFSEAGVTLYSEEAAEKKMADAIAEKGVTQEMLSGEEIWLSSETFAEEIGRPPIKEVEVSTAAELMAALADNTRILLKPGTYNVTNWLSLNPVEQIELEDAYDAQPGIYSHYDWMPAVVCGYSRLQIASKDPAHPAEIVCEPREAIVLTFLNCSELKLENLVMGHTPDKGSCTGNVLGMYSCRDAELKGCDLYGCGAYAFELDGGNIRAEDCTIHDCTYGCIYATYCDSCEFYGCTFRDCEGYTMIEAIASNLWFSDCSFSNLAGDMLYMDEGYNVSFVHCTFDNSMLIELSQNPLFGMGLEIYD